MSEPDLIFLISQPRSGSTLTQKLLSSNKDIYTVSEPWLLLSPVFAMRKQGVSAIYDHNLANSALHEFLTILPKGEDDYWEAVRGMYSSLYMKALEGRDENVFLDKTPRYYYIIEELGKIFPNARQLLLVRNPVAVLSSIKRTWCRFNWNKLAAYKDDLLVAPKLLVEASLKPNINQKIIYYEDLVFNTTASLKDIFSWLQLTYSNTESSSSSMNMDLWKLGDQGLVYEGNKPTDSRMNAWKDHLDSPQFWRCAKEYVDILGDELLGKLGYPAEELWMNIESKRPTTCRLWHTKPLEKYLRL